MYDIILYIEIYVGKMGYIIMTDFDYKSEFLCYLKQYGIKKEILDIDNSNYSDFHKGLIRIVDEQIDELISMMSYSRKINIPIHIYCINDNTVNAFCFITNQHYYIGIHSGVYIQLIERTQTLSESIISKGYLHYTIDDSIELQVALWVFSVRMILSHEYMHIILGHCDWNCKTNKFLWEHSIDNNVDDYRKRQALEMLADEFACMDLMNQAIYYSKNSTDAVKKNIVLYYLSILLTFSIFEEDKDNKMTDHPHLSVRWHYISSVVDSILYKHFSQINEQSLNLLEEIDEVVMDYMQIIQDFPDLFKYNIVAELSMAEVDKEYIAIFNAAADIIPQTNKKAIYPIEEIEKKSEKMWVNIFNAKDEFVNLIQMGKTYEEASEIIIQKFGDGLTEITEE